MRPFGKDETRQQQLERAVHTAVSELPEDTADEDITDCVDGIVGPLSLDEEASVFLMIERMR